MINNITFYIEDMTCSACEVRIEQKLKTINGVKNAYASLSKKCVDVSFDNSVTAAMLENAIKQAGYTVAKLKRDDNNNSRTNLIYAALIIFAVYMLIKHTVGFNFIPNINQGMSYGVLFLVGLMTSVHCLAMCGGINLSQNIAKTADTEQSVLKKLKPSFLYNAGRVVSYTAVGAVVGGAGAVISLTGALKGLVAVFSGLFMLIMGLKLLNISPVLNKFNIKMPKFIINKVYSGKKQHRGPFIIGLLNGFMPCGPLQAIQLYALGTGSAVNGALSMLMFSLGTVPLMFIFGAVSSFLSSKFTHKMLKASGVLVMVLGFAMVNQGLSLSGVSLSGLTLAPVAAVPAATGAKQGTAVVKDNIQEVATSFSSGRYTPITVQSGIPVKWTVKVSAKDLNGCNNPFIIPKYGIEAELKPGDNVIEFTPQGTGTIPYSCWMGMIRSTITVVDKIG